MQKIATGQYQIVFVSPELMVSKDFRAEVLAKDSFFEHLRAAFIDEAHRFSLWGGSFRPNYAELGTLRRCLPHNILIIVMSATLPEHILDNVQSKLKLSEDTLMVAITNARSNIALSVRGMRYSAKSKADLWFLIPKNALFPSDIPTTLVYCNSRKKTEDVTDILRRWLLASLITQEDHHDCVVDVQERSGAETENSQKFRLEMSRGKGAS